MIDDRNSYEASEERMDAAWTAAVHAVHARARGVRIGDRDRSRGAGAVGACSGCEA